MCSSTYLIPLLMFLLLILCCYKTLLPAQTSCLVFQVLSPLPPVPRLRVAIYALLSIVSFYTSLPEFSLTTNDVMHLEVYTPLGCFGTNAPKFRFTNVNSRTLNSRSKSVALKDALPELDFPCLLAGDFNIHNQAADPLRIISRSEESASAPYFDRATDLAYTLLNSLGVYTRFLLEVEHRPGVIDLAFANQLLYPVFVSWDSSSVPSTGSDHVTIKITLSPSPMTAPHGALCGTKLVGRR